MNNDEFVIWFKGFVDAVGDGYPNKTQWEVVLNKLKEIENKPDWLTNSGTWTVPPNTGLPPWPQPYYITDFVLKNTCNTNANNTGNGISTSITKNDKIPSTLTKHTLHQI